MVWQSIYAALSLSLRCVVMMFVG